MNDINNKQSYKGAGNIASNVSNRITGRANFPFAMLFNSKEFYNFAKADKVNLFTSDKLPGFMNNFVDLNPTVTLDSNDVKTYLTYLKPNHGQESYEETDADGRDQQNVIDNDSDSLAVTLRSFLELQKELPEDDIDFIPQDVNNDKVKKLRHFIYESGILNKRDISYILNKNLLNSAETQDRLDMILASSTKASYSGNRVQDSSAETSYSVGDEFVFWEKRDDSSSDGELVRFTFAECITYLLTYIEFYIVFPENKKWKYTLTSEDGFRMNFTMPYWREFDSNSEGKQNSGKRLQRRFDIFKLFYNKFMEKLGDIQSNIQDRTEMQALSIQDFSKRIKDIYREVAYDMYQSYTTRSPTAQPTEDLMSLPEFEEENVTCGTEYRSKFDAVKEKIKGDRIWWQYNPEEERTLRGKPNDYLICINGDGTLNYRGTPYRNYIESLNLQGDEYNDTKIFSHIITPEGQIFGFNNFFRKKGRVRHGMLGKLLLKHNIISSDTGIISTGEIYLDRDFKIRGVNPQSGTFFPHPLHFSNENAILVFKTHLDVEIPFFTETFDMIQNKLVRSNIEGGIGPLTDDDSSDDDEDEERPVNPSGLPPAGSSTELQEIKTPDVPSTTDGDGETYADTGNFDSTIRTNSSGDLVFDEPEDGNIPSSSQTDETDETNPTTNPEGQDNSSNTPEGQDDSSKTPDGTGSGNGSGNGSGSGDGNQHPAQPFLDANRLTLGRIRGNGDCLFVALLRVLGYEQQDITNEIISQFRSDIVDYITSDASTKERQWSREGITDTSEVNFWFMYGESILAQTSSPPNSGSMYADIDDYKRTMKSTEANSEKPAGRFGTVFEIMAFREMFSRDLINLYGSDEIQIVKLDGNNNLVLETPPSSQSRNIAEVDFSLPILLYNRTHYDIAEPLPDVRTSNPEGKTRDPHVPSSSTKQHHDDDNPEDLIPITNINTNKGLMRYVETIFSKNIGEEEQEEINELTRLI